MLGLLFLFNSYIIRLAAAFG